MFVSLHIYFYLLFSIYILYIIICLFFYFHIGHEVTYMRLQSEKFSFLYNEMIVRNNLKENHVLSFCY